MSTLTQFSTARDTQNGSQSHTKKREEGNRDDQVEKKERQKGKEQSSQ